LFRFELKCGKMENRFMTISLKRQLNQVILHEQVENGAVINSNLSGNRLVVCNT
jgi:hypothetical protein